MSYASEYRRLRPVLDMADKWDIANNPHRKAIYESLTSGFQLWATPDEHPDGEDWEKAPMLAGAFSKPCCYVGAVFWGWGDGKDEHKITHLELSTDAFDLNSGKSGNNTKNRPNDIDWAIQKTAWLFRQAKVECPPITIVKAT